MQQTKTYATGGYRLKRARRKVLPTLALCFGCPILGLAYNYLVAFGDSYTDTHNLPSSPPYYWNGRFSNGPLWIEYMSQSLGFSYYAGDNYAVSGSETDELGTQIAKFPGTSDSANVLFAIWSGNNDFGTHLNLGYNDSAWNNEINAILTSLLTASDLVYKKGARNLVLFNQIDLTQVPYIRTAKDANFLSYLRGKINLFNSQLSASVPGLVSAHPGLQVYLIDIYSDLNYLLNNYASYGFTQGTLDALDDPNLSNKTFSGPGSTYVFWDSQHPTTKTHGLIAGWVLNALGTPTTYPAVTISAPQSGAQFTSPASIPISATVNPNGWTINSVLFFHDGELLGQVSSAPYNFTWSEVSPGTYFLTAQASFGSGQIIGSASIPVTVTAPVTAPTIVISAPQNGAQFTSPAAIPISVIVNPNGWAIDSVSFFHDGVLLGQVSNSPYTFSWSGVAAGAYSLSAQASYGSAQTVASGSVQVTVLTSSLTPLPTPWTQQDIGAVGLAGNGSYASNETFTITGSGADIWGAADAFHYVYRTISGDGAILARVTSVQNTDGFAKAGLMFRATLDLGSPNAFQFITPVLGLGFQYRSNPGGSSTYHQGVGVATPYWLKLERKGNVFNGYTSPDGSAWALAGSVALPMTDPIYVGLAVTAHNNSALNTATFTSVQVSQSTAPAPPTLAVARLADGSIQLTLAGAIGESYRFDASPDLSSWTPFSTNVDQSGTIQIIDPQTLSQSQRFYRAALVQ